MRRLGIPLGIISWTTSSPDSCSLGIRFMIPCRPVDTIPSSAYFCVLDLGGGPPKSGSGT